MKEIDKDNNKDKDKDKEEKVDVQLHVAHISKLIKELRRFYSIRLS